MTNEEKNEARNRALPIKVKGMYMPIEGVGVAIEKLLELERLIKEEERLFKAMLEREGIRYEVMEGGVICLDINSLVEGSAEAMKKFRDESRVRKKMEEFGFVDLGISKN